MAGALIATAITPVGVAGCRIPRTAGLGRVSVRAVLAAVHGCPIPNPVTAAAQRVPAWAFAILTHGKSDDQRENNENNPLHEGMLSHVHRLAQQRTVTRHAAFQMGAHGSAGGLGVAGQDGVDDIAVFVVDHLLIAA